MFYWSGFSGIYFYYLVKGLDELLIKDNLTSFNGILVRRSPRIIQGHLMKFGETPLNKKTGWLLQNFKFYRFPYLIFNVAFVQ